MKKLLLKLFALLPATLIMQLVSAQDWPNLKKFQQENNTLCAPKKDENRVVFMGNSVTEGWIKMRPDFFKNNPYINRGISGQTTPQMLIRFRQDVIDLLPNAVVILAGVNDIAGNTGPSTIRMITDNLFSMAELAKANNIKVVFCSVLPAYDFPWKTGMEPAQKIVDLNAKIKEYASKNNIPYVDYYSAMVDEKGGLKEDLGYDGVHPNKDGYAIMEPILEKTLNKLFPENK